MKIETDGGPHDFRARQIPVRWIAERHVIEDLGRIPTMADFLRELKTQPWMVRKAKKLSRDLERSQT